MPNKAKGSTARGISKLQKEEEELGVCRRGESETRFLVTESKNDAETVEKTRVASPTSY